MVGASEKRPSDTGNCFSVAVNDHIEYKIVNFNLENLEELMARGLTWPIRIAAISPHHALLDDPRIGSRWYQNEWCIICTPRELLPASQRMEQLRAIERGDRVELANSVIYKGNKVQFE